MLIKKLLVNKPGLQNRDNPEVRFRVQRSSFAALVILALTFTSYPALLHPQVVHSHSSTVGNNVPNFSLTDVPPVEQTSANKPSAYIPIVRSGSVAYYVDCARGDDKASGLSPSQAWQSLNKANKSILHPGDKLLLKRGCAWAGPLEAKWSGTKLNPILISAYGLGDLPKIQNAPVSNVVITGSYQIIEYLQVRSDPPNIDPGCNNQPYGWRVGFNFMNGASYNTVRHSVARENTVGIKIAEFAHHNSVLNNEVIDNNIAEVLDTTPGNDLGPWGIVLMGDDNEVAYNYLSNNNSWCSYDWGYEGAAIELFMAQRNNIHHNISINDKIFSELGGSATIKTEDNTFAYNLYVSSLEDSQFLILRGAKSPLGPTSRTKVYNNTVYLTHPTSEGIICGAGCSKDILTARNNIIWAERKVFFADAPFNEGYNIFWNSDGTPFVQLQSHDMSSTSMTVDPKFSNVSTQDFTIKPSSPAINQGTSAVIDEGYRFDLAQTSIPQGATVDIGAYEYPFTLVNKVPDRTIDSLLRLDIVAPVHIHLARPALKNHVHVAQQR
jgi:hypothetical protein